MAISMQMTRFRRAGSVPDACRAALVVHVHGCGACRRFLFRAFPERCPQRVNSLPMVQLAFAVLLEASAIAVPF